MSGEPLPYITIIIITITIIIIAITIIIIFFIVSGELLSPQDVGSQEAVQALWVGADR